MKKYLILFGLLLATSVYAFPVTIDSDDLQQCLLVEELRNQSFEFGSSQSGLPQWRSIGGFTGIRVRRVGDIVLIGNTQTATSSDDTQLEIHASSTFALSASTTNDLDIGIQTDRLTVYRSATITPPYLSIGGIFYQWPPNDGTNNQVLHTDGSGVLTWNTDDSGGSGSSAWEAFQNQATVITPTTTNAGTWVTASSTFTSTLQVLATSTFPFGDIVVGTTSLQTMIKDSALLVMPFSADEHGIIIQGLLSQSEHLFMVRDDIGTILFDIQANGEVDINHTAVGNNEIAMDIEVDAAGFGDVIGLFLDYDAGTLSAGEIAAGIVIEVDRFDTTGGTIRSIECDASTGSAGVDCLHVEPGINVIFQDSGVFGDMRGASTTDSGVETNRLTAFTSIGTDVTIFPANSDDVIIGNLTKFEAIEFVLATVASGAGIDPKFEFSTGIGTWTEFVPLDGTNGMREPTGIISYEDDDIPTWAVGTSSEYLIRITRQQQGLGTVPIEDIVQIASVIVYTWDLDGDIEIRRATTTEWINIGTTVPTNELNTGDLFIGAQATSTLSIWIGSGGTANSIDLTGGDLYVQNDAEIDGTLTLGTALAVAEGGTGATSFTNTSIIFSNGTILTEDNSDFVYLDSTKRLGVGTPSPNAPFEVEGAAAGTVGGFSSGILHVTNESTSEFANAIITLHNNFNTNTQLAYIGSTSALNNDIAIINRQNANLIFQTNNTERLRIDASGNVGINTTTPAYKLVVDGALCIDDGTGVDCAAGLGYGAGDLFVGNNATTSLTMSVGELEISDDNFTDLVGDATISFSAGTLRVVDVNCTNCLNATEIEDIYLLIAGDSSSGDFTWTGAHVFSGATLEIPNATNPTVDAIGEIALDTTANQIVVASSTNAIFPIVFDARGVIARTVPSTTMDILNVSRTLIPPLPYGISLLGVMCHATGTSDIVRFNLIVGDATGNLTETIGCGSTRPTVATSTDVNNVFTAGEFIEVKYSGAEGTIDNYIWSLVFGVTRE